MKRSGRGDGVHGSEKAIVLSMIPRMYVCPDVKPHAIIPQSCFFVRTPSQLLSHHLSRSEDFTYDLLPTGIPPIKHSHHHCRRGRTQNGASLPLVASSTLPSPSSVPH